MTVLAETIGMEAVERLSAKVGGTDLAIPGQLVNGKPPPRFAERIGDDRLAVLLILHFGDSKIYIPRLTPGGGPERITVRAVMRLTDKRMSARAIGRKLGCCDRVVYLKRAMHKAALNGSGT